MSTLSFKYRDERSFLRKPRTQKPLEFNFFSSENEFANERGLKNAIRDQERALRVSESLALVDKKGVTQLEIKKSLINDFSDPITKYMLKNITQNISKDKKINGKLKSFFESIEDAIESPDTRPTSEELYFLFGTILKKDVKNKRNGKERVGRVVPKLDQDEQKRVEAILNKMGISVDGYDDLRKNILSIIKDDPHKTLKNANSNREFFYNSLDLIHAKLNSKKSVDVKTATETRTNLIEKFCKDINAGLKGNVISKNLTPIMVEQLLMPADAIGDIDLRKQKKYNIELNNQLSELKKQLTLNNCQNVAVQIDMGSQSQEPLVVPRILLDISNRANSNITASYYTAILKLNSDLDDIQKISDEQTRKSRLKEYYKEVSLNPYKAEAFSASSMNIFKNNLIMNKLLEAAESYIERHPLSPSATNSSLDWLKTTDIKNGKKFSNLKLLAETAGTIVELDKYKRDLNQDKYKTKFMSVLKKADIKDPKIIEVADKFYPAIMERRFIEEEARATREFLHAILKTEGGVKEGRKNRQIANVMMYARKQILEQYLKEIEVSKNPIIGLGERDAVVSKISKGVIGQARYFYPHELNMEAVNFAESQNCMNARIGKLSDFTKNTMNNPYIQITLGKNVHQYKKENFDNDDFTLSQRVIEGTSLMLKKELSTLDAKGKSNEKEKLIKSYMDTFVEISAAREELLSLNLFSVAAKNKAKKIVELAENSWFSKIESSAENISKRGKYGTVMAKNHPNEYKTYSLFADVNEANSVERMKNLIKVTIEEFSDVLNNQNRDDLENNAKDYAIRMAYMLKNGSKNKFNPTTFVEEFSNYSRMEQLDFLKKYIPLKTNHDIFGDIIRNIKKEDSTVYKVLRDELTKKCTNEKDIAEISAVISADRVRNLGYSINRLTQTSLKLIDYKTSNPVNPVSMLMDKTLFKQEFGAENEKDYNLCGKFKNVYQNKKAKYYKNDTRLDMSSKWRETLKKSKAMVRLEDGLSYYRRDGINLKDTKLDFYDKAVLLEDEKNLKTKSKKVSQKEMK